MKILITLKVKKVRLFEDGQIRETRIHKVSRDLSDLSSADVVIIYIQSNYHEALIKKLSLT